MKKLCIISPIDEQVRYGLICWGRADKDKTNEISRLVNRATRCIHFESQKENVSEIKITKKVLDIENMLKYDLSIFMHKLKRII